MRSIIRVLTLAGFIGVGFVAFNNFAPIGNSEKPVRSPLEQDTADEVKSEKEYVKIDGRLYEKNSRDVYYVDGVPTYVKTEKLKPKPTTATSAKNPKLGLPIDLNVMKDAMGLDGDDEFFKHSGDEQ
jgi:hypothetical protein